MILSPDGHYYILQEADNPQELSFYMRYFCIRCGAYTSMIGVEFHNKFHERIDNATPDA